MAEEISEPGQSSCDNVAFAHRSNHGTLPGSGSAIQVSKAGQFEIVGGTEEAN